MNLDRRIVNAHHQIHACSCIPSSVELVLKLNGMLAASDHSLQEMWGLNPGGSLQEFDPTQKSGPWASRNFGLQFRAYSEDIPSTLRRIDNEVTNGHFVIATQKTVTVIPEKTIITYHTWVIYEVLENRYLAVTKSACMTIDTDEFRQWLARDGSHVLTYL